MDKVIFLDFDGVLASMDYLRITGSLKNEMILETNMDVYGSLFDPRCVLCLQWIIEKTKAKIVVSSVWKFMGFEKILAMWDKRDLPGKIIDITPNIDGCSCRGNEIAQWLQKNNCERYIIIDDDSDMLEEQLPFFIHTNSIYGLNHELSVKAIKILND